MVTHQGNCAEDNNTFAASGPANLPIRGKRTRQLTEKAGQNQAAAVQKKAKKTVHQVVEEQPSAQEHLRKENNPVHTARGCP
mmetsp:Transcript_23387/g.60876  ORF Transcript_23387/g.60876 Transcript_23387/m.60876 type:complete len:82 (+) Transcript_23387:127-372(+)